MGIFALKMVILAGALSDANAAFVNGANTHSRLAPVQLPMSAVPYVPTGFTPEQWKKQHEEDIREAHAIHDTHTHLIEDVDFTSVHFVKDENTRKAQQGVAATATKAAPRGKEHIGFAKGRQ